MPLWRGVGRGTVLARSRRRCRCLHTIPHQLVWLSNPARLSTGGRSSFVRFRRPASPRARLDGTVTEGGGVDPVSRARWCHTGTIAALWPAPPATARAAPAAPHWPVTSVSRPGVPKAAHNGALVHPLVCVHRSRSVVLARRRPRCRRRRPRTRGPLHACATHHRPPLRPNPTPTASLSQRTDHNRHPHRRAHVVARSHSGSRRAHEPSPRPPLLPSSPTPPLLPCVFSRPPTWGMRIGVCGPSTPAHPRS